MSEKKLRNPVRFAGNQASSNGSPVVAGYSDDQKLQREMQRLAKKAGGLGMYGLQPDTGPTFNNARHAWRSYKANQWDGSNAPIVALEFGLVSEGAPKEQALEALAMAAEDEEITNVINQEISNEEIKNVNAEINVMKSTENPQERRKKQREAIEKHSGQRRNSPSNISYGDEADVMETQYYEGGVVEPQENTEQSRQRKDDDKALGLPHSAIPTTGTGYPDDNAKSHSAQLEDPEAELRKIEAKRQELIEKCRAIHAQKVASVCEFIVSQENPETLGQIQKALNKARELSGSKNDKKQDFSTVKVEVTNG
ncbi:MAG TPA: hypothetical protein VNX68_09490 [Nitrosopumilaceae archaeon]|jgi:hypothetical protein|nr:hypothetical protein [Nitrosopumilaceae archaeon]